MGKMYDALQKMEREKYPEVKVASSEPTPDDIVLDDKLVSYFQPSSMVAEQFRRLRQYIIKPGIDDSPKALLVTSAMAGEGKSLIAINLAITIAIELHSHALLVDCDLRNPSLSRFFGLHEALGLSDYLQGNVELDGLFVKTSVDKLSVLCGGSLQDNPVELIGSNKMKSLIQDLRSRYNDRYIILDSSPLLATTEPSVLNEMVDGILYVVKAGETPRETVVQAMNLLRKEKIMGVVLNSVEFKTQALIRRYFGMHHYYYDYRYSKTHPAPGMRGRLSLFTKDMKAMMFGRKDKK
jgi:exopolysaccharide/PEP-CTERM locus tyrosine autokinase